MRIAVTGATGFIGHYLVQQLVEQGHHCRLWARASSDRSGFESLEGEIEWIEGELGQADRAAELVAGCEAVVHSALYHPAGGFMGGEGDLLEFVQKNIVGSLQLIEAARRAGVGRFVYISTCAVHDKILNDRPLDETHPLWPMSHYGAHKGAVEKFVHSYGLGHGYPICALRPTGVYGAARPIENSKWFDLVQAVVRGEEVHCNRGGKEVHAADVAKGASLLLSAEGITGEAYNCYDRYVSQYEVAQMAKEISGSAAKITGEMTQPKHQIVTEKIRKLGMEFGGEPLLRQTIEQLVAAVQ